MSCVFCDIRDGKIPADIVYEDEDVLAFHDISKAAKTHIVLIPKKHIPNILDEAAPELMTSLTRAIQNIAQKQSIEDAGFRVINNCGEGAGQTIMHLHLHILSGPELTERIV